MRRVWFSLLFLLFFAPHVPAQDAPAPAAAIPITLGQSAVALNGPWKFHTGDNPQWAQPGFDDSGWQDYILDPKHPKLDAVQAVQSGQLTGWQQHGHPGYTGYAWYRIRLQTPPDASSLALLMPQYVEDAYEVYVNGQKIGSFGKVDGWHVVYPQQAKLFSIPLTALKGGQPVVLAIRFWNFRYEAFPSGHNLDGGLRGLPLLGPSELLHVFRQSVMAQTWKTLWPVLLTAALYLAVGMISLFLFLFSRSHREYLWAGVSLTSIGFLVVFEMIAVAPESSISLQLSEVAGQIAQLIGYFALSLAAMHLLGVPRPLWRRANYIVLAGLLALTLLYIGLHFGLLPPSAAIDRVRNISFVTVFVYISLLLLAIAVDGLRTLGRKAWLPLTPGLLTACGLIVQMSTNSYSASFDISNYFYLSVPVAVLVIFLMRFTEQQRENVRLVDDMKQAQEVQQVLIPEELPHVPGLTIESIYRPAQQVGGDFFQIIPRPDDGSVLIVVGDVTGKGLQAGMLVALIVGATRTAAQFEAGPLTVLHTLNQRLCGRGQSYATCLALQISCDGVVTLANAGHLPPYLNGKELPMEGAPPLGMISGAEFSVMRFELVPGDTLVLMTDGVAEARDKQGHLFGFERVNEMMEGAVSAATLASAAQKFGQQDDITIVSIERVGEDVVAVA